MSAGPLDFIGNGLAILALAALGFPVLALPGITPGLLAFLMFRNPKRAAT